MMKDINRYALVIIIVGICLVFGVLNPVFLSYTNIVNIFNQVAILSLIAFGMTLVILIGGIDLSVGSVVALSGIVLAECLVSGLSIPLSIIICIATGALCGLLNGILVSYGKIAPFIATLGMMSAARGLALMIADGRAVSSFPKSISFISNFSIVGLPLPIIIFISIFLILFLFQHYTYWGRHIMAVGGNENAAWQSGINVKKYKLLVYTICGITTAIGSIILVSKLNSAQPQAGLMYELDAIAAAVIGGASLSGGRGRMFGTLLGALIIGILINGLSILNVPVYYQQILIGLIIISAVLLDKLNITIKRRKHENS
jgi:ribose/xylose/arabinose/galactoside ABC-type transport system permease subunit